MERKKKWTKNAVVESAEIKFLRSMGVKRLDKIKNDVTRNLLKVDHLNNTIKNYR